MKVQFQSVAKQEEGYIYTNQDAARYDLVKQIFAISDGAGGEGQNADAWAQHLVTRIIDTPYVMMNIEQFSTWFMDTQSSFAQDTPAYATLAAAWVYDHKWYVLSYGDSGVYIYNKNHSLKYKNINHLYDYTYDPYLLCNKEAFAPRNLQLHTMPYDPKDILLLATDAISQWIYIQIALQKASMKPEITQVYDSPYALGNIVENNMQVHKEAITKTSPKQLIPFLKKQLMDTPTFYAFTQALFAQQCIAFDDYTLLIAQ